MRRIFIFSAFSAAAIFTPVLRPVFDGQIDSSLWSADGYLTCSKLNCYFRVRETKGNFCGGASDGDFSYIESQSQNALQTFRLNASSVPNLAAVKKITVNSCARKIKEKDPENSFQLSACVNGKCEDSGQDVFPTVSYATATHEFNFDFQKATSTLIEIGAKITGNKNKLLRFSSLSAIIEYLPEAPVPPADLPVPTAGGSPAVQPTLALFSGQTYPGGSVEIIRESALEEQYRVTPQEFLDINESGVFQAWYRALLQGPYSFSLSAVDPEGRKSEPIRFVSDFLSTDKLIKENLVFSPTGELRGGSAVGYAAAGAEVLLELDGEFAGQTQAGPSGFYAIALPELPPGFHKIDLFQFREGRASASLPLVLFVSDSR